MQPVVGMKVMFRNSSGSVYTVSKFVKVYDPLAGQDRYAFCLDSDRVVYFADQFDKEFLVVLEDAE